MNKRAWHGRLLSESLPCIVAACLVGFVIALLPQTQLILLAAVTAALLVVGAIFAEPIVGLALALIVGPFNRLSV